jgi:ElaB/YqjD/DUF883 family membrane-anchored ribosome-binding protein
MTKIDYEAKIVTLETELRKLRHALAGRDGHADDDDSSIRANFAEAADRIKEALGGVRDTSKKAAHTVETKIQDHPWISVLAATGVGLLLGCLLSKRRGD